MSPPPPSLNSVRMPTVIGSSGRSEPLPASLPRRAVPVSQRGRPAGQATLRASTPHWQSREHRHQHQRRTVGTSQSSEGTSRSRPALLKRTVNFSGVQRQQQSTTDVNLPSRHRNNHADLEFDKWRRWTVPPSATAHLPADPRAQVLHDDAIFSASRSAVPMDKAGQPGGIRLRSPTWCWLVRCLRVAVTPITARYLCAFLKGSVSTAFAVWKYFSCIKKQLILCFDETKIDLKPLIMLF